MKGVVREARPKHTRRGRKEERKKRVDRNGRAKERKGEAVVYKQKGTNQDKPVQGMKVLQNRKKKKRNRMQKKRTKKI